MGSKAAKKKKNPNQIPIPQKQWAAAKKTQIKAATATATMEPWNSNRLWKLLKAEQIWSSEWLWCGWTVEGWRLKLDRWRRLCSWLKAWRLKLVEPWRRTGGDQKREERPRDQKFRTAKKPRDQVWWNRKPKK